MVRSNKMPVNNDITTVSIPPVTALCIGAFTGGAAWFVIYCVCPKPLFDRFLDWWHADRPGPPRERPTSTAMTLDGSNGAGEPSRNDYELQDHSARRPSSPTETIETRMFGSGFSTPEPLLVTSGEERD